VDDHPENNQNEHRMFRQPKAEVDSTKSTAEAVRMLKHGNYGIVLSDMEREGEAGLRRRVPDSLPGAWRPAAPLRRTARGCRARGWGEAAARGGKGALELLSTSRCACSKTSQTGKLSIDLGFDIFSHRTSPLNWDSV
jgi:hypothetical protein